MKKIFAMLLILLGIVLIFSPKVKDQVVEQKVKETVEVIETITAEEIKVNEVSEEAEFDFSIVEDISVTGTLMATGKINNDLLVGQLVIPSVDMNIPIFKGINNANLLAGSATMRKDQKMGTGNYPLAGHYMKEKNVLFGSLMDVKEGDLIRMTDKETIFEYVTYEVKVVPDTALYIIDNEESEKIGNPIISIMTCYYSSNTEKRYFVMGELVDSYPYTEDALHAE